MTDCVDNETIDLAARVARSLDGLCKSAVIVLTSACPRENHGTHTTAAIASRGMSPREARAMCAKLRALADNIEKSYAAAGSEN